MSGISYDTETSLVSDREPVPRMVCAGFGWGPTAKDTALFHHRDAEGAIRDVLESSTPDEPLIGAKLPFDGVVTCERFPDLEPLWWSLLSAGAVHDVLTCERLLDIADGFGVSRGYGLGTVSKRRAGIEIDKTDPWRKRYVELIDLPIEDWPDAAVHYATNDLIAPWVVRQKQVDVRCDGLDPLADAPAQARAHWALHLSSLHGIRVDQARVHGLVDEMLTERAALAEKLVPLGVVRANGSVVLKELQKHAEQAGVTRKTKRGVGTSLDDFQILGLEDDHPCMLTARYQKLGRDRSKLLNGYDRPIIRPWYQELLVTGRVSANEPNTTQLPRKGGWRECLVPAEGNVFVIADWSTAELRAWAFLLIEMFGEDAPSAALANAFREGRDPHTELAADLSAPRGAAKGPNFGLPGGMGLQRFIEYLRKQWDVVVDPETARGYIQAWRRRWRPQQYFGWAKRQLEAGGGRAWIQQYRSGRLRGGCSYSEAANGLFQGFVADFAKETLWKLAVEMYTMPSSDLYGARQAIFAHDENVLECPREDGDKVAARLERIMLDVANDWHPGIPAAVDVKIVERYTK